MTDSPTLVEVTLGDNASWLRYDSGEEQMIANESLYIAMETYSLGLLNIEGDKYYPLKINKYLEG
jgi:hypothetical protein